MTVLKPTTPEMIPILQKCCLPRMRTAIFTTVCPRKVLKRRQRRLGVNSRLHSAAPPSRGQTFGVGGLKSKEPRAQALRPHGKVALRRLRFYCTRWLSPAPGPYLRPHQQLSRFDRRAPAAAPRQHAPNRRGCHARKKKRGGGEKEGEESASPLPLLCIAFKARAHAQLQSSLICGRGEEARKDGEDKPIT